MSNYKVYAIIRLPIVHLQTKTSEDFVLQLYIHSSTKRNLQLINKGSKKFHVEKKMTGDNMDYCLYAKNTYNSSIKAKKNPCRKQK